VLVRDNERRWRIFSDPDVIYAALDLGPDNARIYVLAPSVAA
jgi:hypothetical protein